VSLTDDELDRYARHIVLREIGGPGQAKLKRARVLVVGAGGLGAPALLYLASAGVGALGIVDDDVVALSNLQRQVIHATGDVGRRKTDSARDSIAAINPHVVVAAHEVRLTQENADALLADYDLALDGTDNFDARLALNAACARAGKPLVSAAIGQWEGQLSVYDPASGAPCFACVFPQRPAEGLAPSCAAAGVVGALAGVMGSLQAVEAVKLIAGAGRPLRGRLLLYDALWAEFRVIETTRRSDCPVCGAA
jgi:molybdopterin/thiamine biosynthesis adenylyltransferase